MLPRLLCFLSDIERALAADEPAPGDGSWDNRRTVNYSLDLARLCLNARLGDGTLQVRGIINLQGFTLADGTSCLKAALTWSDSTVESLQAIYTKPGLNWTGEARRMAALWLDGPPAEALVAATLQPETDRLAQTG